MGVTSHASQPATTGRRAASSLMLTGRYAGGDLDPTVVAEQVFADIRACADQAIFTRLSEDRARDEAAASTRRWREGRAKGPLDGVPVAWKDLFDLAGETTTAGSKVLADDAPADADAPVVSRLAATGMTCVGRVNMTEFAYSGIGINPHYGTPFNPHGPSDRINARVPGGSSSGSGVAVARGLVPISIGSDTGGSVRIPAAFNGIVGYKASSGRYPMDGVFPLSRSLDTLGVLSRCVEDAVLTDAAMQGLVVSPVRRRSPAGVRIVVPENVVFDQAEPAVTANCEAALSRLAKADARIERTRLPALDAILALYARHGALVSAEAYHQLKDKLEGPAAQRMDRRVVKRALLGAKISAADYCELMDQRRRLIAEMQPLFDSGAFVAFPTVAHVAPSLAALEADDELFVRVNMLTLRNTMLGNFLDWCGVSLPNGADGAGLPTGLLISGGPGDDDALLSFALGCEAAVRGEY